MKHGKIAYLGDGVNATFDGYQIWLSTERETGTHKIALEPEALRELLKFVESLQQKGVWP